MAMFKGMHRDRAASALVACALAVAGSSGVAAKDLSAGADWSTPSGSMQGSRYSTLTQIDTSNVATLVEDFAVPTNTPASHQGQPLVVGGVMYVVTPFPNRLLALDVAKAGKALWTFRPEVDEFAHGVACCDTINRGAAYGDGLVVFATLDDTVVAVDARTGKPAWRTRLGRPETGETLTGAPLVVGKIVIVGSAGAELGTRGWVAGLDLTSGKEVWRAYGTGPDADVKIGAGFHPFYAKDRGENLGQTTWPGDLWKQGGATSWAWLTYDPELNLLYHGTANPGVWNPDMRVGDKSNPDQRRSDNKWGASIFARDTATGAAKWVYQLTPHDSWDYDAVNESIVADLKIGGEVRKVVVHFNKNGFAYTIDRRTGEVLVAKKFGEANWADHVDLATGLPAVSPAKVPHQGEITSNICPSPLGVKDWEPSSFSPQTSLFYVPAINFCYALQPLKAIYIAGAPFMGADISFAPGPNGPGGKAHLGELVAWDAAVGKKSWGVEEPLPLYGGVLTTAGGLVFYGTLDKHFKALDAKTGKLLFDTTLECGTSGNPIAFTGADGKERIAIYSGLGWLAGGFAGGACATKPVGATRAGGMVHVFKLP